MANVQVKDIRKDKRKQNYDSCKVALDETGEALLPFTEDKLKDLHQQISLQVGNQLVCYQQCSCLQEYSPLLPTSPLLVDYFKQHGPLVGRGWLFQLLDEQLNNTKKNGILLEADMGYGKSAIAAHITRAKDGDQGMEMRKRLIAFHVC
ncbi:hypothetical protein MAR_025912, partial [Mya arenaria]